MDLSHTHTDVLRRRWLTELVVSYWFMAQTVVREGSSVRVRDPPRSIHSCRAASKRSLFDGRRQAV